MTPHIDYDLSIDDLPQECIDDCSAQGSVDDAVEYWVGKLNFSVNPERARRCLKGYGAWDAEELADNDANVRRILWLACGNFKEWQTAPDSGSDIFVLES